MTPRHLESRLRFPHVPPRVLFFLAMLVMACALYGISQQGRSADRTTSNDNDRQQRVAQVGACERGNVIRATAIVTQPLVGRNLLLLDCRATVMSKGGAVPMSASDAALFEVGVRACIEAAGHRRTPTPYCVTLMNGRVRGVPFVQ